MTSADILKARRLLALKDFYQKSLEAHTGVRLASVVVLAGFAALLLPGWWWAGVLAGTLVALAFEVELKASLTRTFAAGESLSAEAVLRVSQRTIWKIVALCWAYAAPYLAMAAAPAPGQAFALVFGVGAVAVIASQHVLTRTMATWTSLPFVLMIAANAGVLAGAVWPAFALLTVLTIINIYVVTGATHASATQLIDAQLEAQRESHLLEQRVAARTEELDHALQQAQAASQAKSRFLATMSHELRTPLNAVIGFAEMIQEDAKSGRLDTIGVDAARVRAAGLHLLGVINEILDITTIEAGAVELTPAPFSARRMVEDAVEQARPLALARGNRIDIVWESDPGTLNADAARVRQCLASLLSNAAKFTMGGSIDVRVARTLTTSGRAGVRFTVVDTGIGIAADKLDGVFKPFAQIDDSYSRSADGSGLGLAITRRLARLMGGDVAVESTLGQGSRFTLTIADVPVSNRIVA